MRKNRGAKFDFSQSLPGLRKHLIHEPIEWFRVAIDVAPEVVEGVREPFEGRLEVVEELLKRIEAVPMPLDFLFV